MIAEEKGIEPIPLGVVARTNDRGAWVTFTVCGYSLQRKSGLPFA